MKRTDWIWLAVFAMLFSTFGFNLATFLYADRMDVPAPAPTVTVRIAPQSDAATPDPTVTVTVTARPTEASRSRSASAMPVLGWAAGDWGRFPSWVEQTALCIAKHESWNDGIYASIGDYPEISTASGFAQWINSSWQAQAKRAGVGTQYSRAYLAPPRVQASVFAHQVMNYGLYPWKGTNCG